MKIINFTYSGDWPFAFSDAFVQYVNYSIKGDILFIEKDSFIVPVIIKLKYIFKIGYIIHRPYSITGNLKEEEEKAYLSELNIFLVRHFKIQFLKTTLHVCTYNSPHSLNVIRENLGIIRIIIANRSINDIFNSFQAQYRNIIRKAEKDKVEIRTGHEQFPVFYELYKEKFTLEKAIHNSWDEINLLYEKSKPLSNIDCMVSYVNNQPDSAIFNGIGGKIVYNLLAVSKKRPLHKGSLKYLHWHAIKKYHVENIKHYQLGGISLAKDTDVKLKNILDFKLRFGSAIEHGQHFTIVNNKLMYNLYMYLMKINK